MMQLAPLPTVAIIHERLQQVFSEGIGNRNYLTREMAAKTVFVMSTKEKQCRSD